jgi:hypothetical protein
MDLAWLSFIVGTVFSVGGLYFTVRADRRAERDWRAAATNVADSSAVRPPRPAPVYPPLGSLSGGPAGRSASRSIGGFALWAGYVEVVLIVSTVVYMIPGYMVKSYDSVQEYADAFQAGVILTALTAIGLAASAWIHAQTDLRLDGRIIRRVVYLHAVVALAGLIVCIAAAVTNPQYVL